MDRALSTGQATPMTQLAATREPEESLIDARDIRVEVDGSAIVDGVDIRLAPGEILGLVGESGSGKTTTALALLGYTTENAVITGGRAKIAGRLSDLADQRGAQRRRGRTISYVPQNPGTSLNPSLKIGATIREMLRAHGSGDEGVDGVAQILDRVHLPATKDFRTRYPHQLSGGQQQRVCIAVAIAGGAPIVVLDEPTTGLDVVTQAHVLDELRRLRDDENVSMIYVSHDLAVVGQIADRIAVMYAGRVVEHGPALEVLRQPRHPYTSGLVASIPDHVDPRQLDPMPGVAVGVGHRPPGCAFAPRCPLRTDECGAAVPGLRAIGDDHTTRCIHPEEVMHSPRLSVTHRPTARQDCEAILEVSDLRIEHRSGQHTVVAAHDVNLKLVRGGCVALVGESGSGKTSIARALAGLQPTKGGTMLLGGAPLTDRAKKRSAEQRRRLQIIFQNPADALNPRVTIGDTIGRPVRSLRRLGKADAEAEVQRLLELVRLPRSSADRYPSQLSGGERQRVGIARALAANPDVLICDEITSALDVSVQAAVLTLLAELRAELGLSLLFITHDLGVVATIADDVVVLKRGHVLENGPVDQVLRHPSDSYTQRLLESAPSITHTQMGADER